MCGIAGFIFPRPKRAGAELQAMSDSLEHRGPDNSGWALENEGALVVETRQKVGMHASNVFLAHRRLSIQDLSEAGVQPMVSADGNYVIVFNGEVYNFLELRVELELLGCTFRTGTDTEVLLNAFIVWQEEAIKRFVGMFAIAIWDRRGQRVFFARDHAGIKPIYYCGWQDGIAFASEIKALLKLPGVSRQADCGRVFRQLRFGITDYDYGTMFSAVKQVLPGTQGWVSVRNPSFDRFSTYFDLRDPDPPLFHDLETAKVHLRNKFLESVELHLRSDVPVGVALSGGIDSTAVMFAIRHIKPDAELHSFSYISNEKSVSEEPWVDLVVEGAKCIAHKVSPAPEELRQDFKDIVYYQDQPCAEFAIYPRHRVSKLAQDNGIKVLLSGEGGDELFAGYTGYAATRVASHLLGGDVLGAFSFARTARALPGRESIWYEAAQYMVPYGLQGPFRHLLGKQLFPRWINKSWFEDADIVDQPIVGGRRRHLVRDALDTAIASTTIPHLLKYQDRASMAYSVESRVPLLTGDFIEASRQVSDRLYFSPSGMGKHVFIEALKGIVPDVLLERNDKIGFGVDRAPWVFALSDMIDNVFRSERAEACGAIDQTALLQMWDDVRHGKRAPTPYIWRCMNFIEWSDCFDVVFD